MRILLFAQHYAPEEVSGAVLATELAEDLARLGHEIAFVTCAPNYPAGRVFPGYGNPLLGEAESNGVRIIRVWSYIAPSRRFWARILNFGSFSLMALLGGFKAGRPHVLFSYSPPLPLGVSAWLLSRVWGIPWVLRVEDLYPDTAVSSGVLKNRWAISFFYRMERFLYSRADHISLISEGFRKNLLSKGISAEKLSVTPVWADPDIVQPMPKENSFRRKHGLEGKFVVMYAGNLGRTAAMDEVLDAAGLIHEKERVRFVIVGEGADRDRLWGRIQSEGLDKVLLLPFQPRESFPEMMAAADIHLVTLNTQSSSYSLPSKTFNIMASGRPILAVTPSDSEPAKIVTEGQCGINVPPGRPDALAASILDIEARSGAAKTMGENGRKLLLAHYSRRACVASFARILSSGS
jgi:colanic acid biosynthesis glycosyl transferase WcaI